MCAFARNILLASLLFCFCSAGDSLWANGTPKVLNFTPEQYRGQYQNWMLSAAPDGRLFAANSGGMLYYDGSRWFLQALPNKQVLRSILYQSPDRVYTGAYGEFGYWSLDAGHQWAFKSLSGMIRDPIFQQEEIWHITQQDSLIWFQSFSRIYSYDGHRIRSYQAPGSIMFVEAFGKGLLVPVIGKGLFTMDREGHFKAFAGAEFLAADRIVGITRVKDSIWVATERRGVFTWDGQRWGPWESPANKQLRQHTLNRMLRTRAGQWYFGTIDAGVLVADAQGLAPYWLNKQDGLQNNTVLSLCESPQGHIWMGLDEGIDAILHTPGLHFQVEKAGMLGTCYAFAAHLGRLYVGSNQGLFVADLKDLRQPGKMHFSRLEGVSGQVWYISLQKGQLIVGHNDGTGLVEGDRLRPLSGLSGGWSLVGSPEREGHLLEGIYTGISRYRFVEGTWKWSGVVEGFRQPVKKLIIDRLGNLWALHPNKGLYWIRCKPDWSQVLEIREIAARNKLPHPFELDILEVDGRVILRSGNKYYEANPETASLSDLKTLRGVDIDGMEEMLIAADKRGLWFSGNGVLRWTNGDAERSWPIGLIERYESLQMLEGYFIAGVHNGFAVLEAPGSSEIPVLDSVRLLAISPLNSPEDRLNIAVESKSIELAAGVNSIRLWFGRDLVDQGRKIFYRLGKDWQAMQGYSLDLADQAFGSLKLEWKLGKEGPVREFEIRLLPRWYQSNLARGMYVLIAILGLALFSQFMQRRFSSQQKALEEDSQRRLNEQQIETQNALLQADLSAKSRELALSSQALIHKNTILTDILEEVQAIKAELGSRMPEKHYKRLESLIQENIESEHERQVFEINFVEVHADWLNRLREKFPELTPGDLRLAAYLKMNLSSKEIAPLLGISIRGVENKRYRLRHKMGIAAEENLVSYLLAL